MDIMKLLGIESGQELSHEQHKKLVDFLGKNITVSALIRHNNGDYVSISHVNALGGVCDDCCEYRFCDYNPDSIVVQYRIIKIVDLMEGE